MTIKSIIDLQDTPQYHHVCVGVNRSTNQLLIGLCDEDNTVKGIVLLEIEDAVRVGDKITSMIDRLRTYFTVYHKDLDEPLTINATEAVEDVAAKISLLLNDKLPKT